MPGFGGLGAIKAKATGAFGGGSWNSSQQYEEFGDSLKKQSSLAKDDGFSSPDSIPEHARPPLRKIDYYLRPECPCLSKRATVALLSCMGFIIMFGMRTSMGIVKLESKKTNGTEGTLASIDSAIFWGYFITQIPGGLIAAAYPANKLFGAAIVSSSILNLFIPAFYNNTSCLIILKVMQGLVEGVTYPACHGIFRYWAPPLERSRLATLAFSGCYAGVMFAMPISGEIMERLGKFGPFYFYGVAGIIWYITWLWLVFEKPCYHTTIESKELKYIESSLGSTNENVIQPTISNTPWKTFFKSMPCYAIFVANFCRSWNFYLLVLFQASYFEDTYHTQIETNAMLGALPHLLMTIIVPSGGILADKLRKNGILTTTQVRKLFNCGGFGMEATFFIIMAYSNTITQGITALSIGVAFSGFAISGFNVNHLDIAPKYASILMGMSNGIGTIAGCICPYVVHLVIGNEHTTAQWRVVFLISACIHYAGIVFYGIFASGELQPWADSTAEDEKNWNQMNENPKSPMGKSNGLLQRKPSNKNYGSVETPFSGGTVVSPQASLDRPQRPPAPSKQPSFSQPHYMPQQPLQPPTPPVQPVVHSANPFLRDANPFRQEPVQPVAQDSYLHGTIEDRTY